MLNMTFKVIFTLEAILKIFALRCNYFKDSWNFYDFSIVMTTYAFVAIASFNTGTIIGSTTTILRTLRVGRIFRLVNKAR